jgi:magnesium-transporting ATPase (P-type)
MGEEMRGEERGKALLCCSTLFYAHSDDQGIAFVETSNLDGETNLKIRQAHPTTAQLSKDNLVSCSAAALSLVMQFCVSCVAKLC